MPLVLPSAWVFIFEMEKLTSIKPCGFAMFDIDTAL